MLNYNKLFEENVQHVDMVLKILEEKKMYENTSKCPFGVQELKYLGHILSDEGVKVDPKKIKVMMGWLL